MPGHLRKDTKEPPHWTANRSDEAFWWMAPDAVEFLEWKYPLEWESIFLFTSDGL